MIISFSGLDGVGKTTQITDLAKHLERQNFQVITKLIYTNSTFLRLGGILKLIFPKKANSMVEKQYRERPSKGFFVNFFRLIRQGCFIFDLCRFYFLVYLPNKSSTNKIILCDRYFYDLLIKMVYLGMCSNFFIKIFKNRIPHCDISFLLLDQIERILERKVEYDMQYYIAQDEMFRNFYDNDAFKIIEGKSQEEVTQLIRASVNDWIELRRSQSK